MEKHQIQIRGQGQEGKKVRKISYNGEETEFSWLYIWGKSVGWCVMLG